MKYWWVNHKQTFKQEVNGGYMWSPKKMSNGGKSHFYDNMNRVSTGDIVFSFASNRIQAVGTVISKASSLAKPSEFGKTGDYWSMDGWFVPVNFKLLDKPFRPKDAMGEIAELLPDKYSPIQKNGNGNQTAYLSEISYELASVIQSLIGDDQLFNQLASIGTGVMLDEEDDKEEEKIRQRTDIGDTEKECLTKARRGQGIFKSNVETIENGCRVTGVKQREHLRASHIKPWRIASDKERLDGHNGLLLAPHIDHLFDRGFISFSDSGELLLSKYLEEDILEAWGIKKDLNVGTFSQQAGEYLQYHRAKIFERSSLGKGTS
jgi:hypothetical protein